MHTPSWTSDRPTASRCSVVGFVTPPHRAAAGGPPEDEDGRDADGYPAVLSLSQFLLGVTLEYPLAAPCFAHAYL